MFKGLGLIFVYVAFSSISFADGVFVGEFREHIYTISVFEKTPTSTKKLKEEFLKKADELCAPMPYSWNLDTPYVYSDEIYIENQADLNHMKSEFELSARLNGWIECG